MQKNHQIKSVEPLTDFAQAEEKQLKHWYSSGIVDKYLKKNQTSSKTFSFFDGPITANNPMGVHHGWGRTYKDLWQRYFNLRGFRQRFQNGFDSQGLWVEVEVEKQLGFKSKKDIEKYGIAKFVQKCKDRVQKFAAIQTKQSQRLGYFMDWDNSYFTMSDENNYMIWHFLKVCHQNGWLYKGFDSVPWCPRCETAISQHEMLTEDYQQVTHQSIYLSLPIQGKKNQYLLIWTTTPWTIPANIAVAVDSKISYSLVKVSSKISYWVASDAVSRIFADTKHLVVKTAKGQKLVGLKYSGAFDHLPAVKSVARNNSKTFHFVVATDERILPISTAEGTGLVHTAVSAGSEDFKLGKKLKLPMIPIIADDASYLDNLGFLSGKNAKKNPQVVLGFLEKLDQKPDQHWVFKIENYSHRYPGCWRCKTELVWKVTDEWYIAMDKSAKKSSPPDSNSTDETDNFTLRQKMIAVAKKINWIPGFGLDRELDWLNNMHDWLISKKNRYWGLCLPIWECDKCGQFEVIGSKDELKVKATKGWGEFAGKSPHKPQLDQVKIKCSQCGEVVSRIEPVGSPWLDAGIIPFSTLVDPKTKKVSYTSDKKYFDKWFPANFITESFPGQFKNWFYSLIAMSTVLEDRPPFKTVLGFATLLAEDGRPMHKSWGNSIEFNEGADKIGVDIMRWMYARQNPQANLLFGYNTASEVKRQFHLILYNSYRFFANYAALEKWQFTNSPPKKLTPLDQWMLSRLSHTQENVQNYLDKFETFPAAQQIEKLVSDFSTWYIRRSRDRVGPTAPDQAGKDTSYWVMHTVLTKLSVLLSPFIPFISDRIYTNLTGMESVHLSSWPTANKSWQKKLLEKQMELLRSIVEKGHAHRKKLQLPLRQPLNSARVTGYSKKLSQKLIYLLQQELNVKKIIWGRKTGELTTSIDPKINSQLKAEGEVRKLIRQIQNARKAAETKLDEWIVLQLPQWPKDFEAEIKQKALVSQLKKGPSLKIISR